MDERWRRTFNADLALRNACESDCFVEIFQFLQKLTDERLPVGQISTNTTASTDISAIKNTAALMKTSLPWEAKTAALEERVRALETQVRTAENAVAASRVCFRELQNELQEKEDLVHELLTNLARKGSLSSCLCDDDNRPSATSDFTGSHCDSLTSHRKTRLTSYAALKVSADIALNTVKTRWNRGMAAANVQPKKASKKSPTFVARLTARIVELALTGNSLLALTADGTISTFHLDTMAIECTFKATPAGSSTESELSLLRCTDDLIAVAGTTDACLYIGRRATQKIYAGLRGHGVHITGCEFLSKDLLVTSGHDGTVRLWSLGLACCLFVLHCGEPVMCLTSSRSPKRGSASDDDDNCNRIEGILIATGVGDRVIFWQVQKGSTYRLQEQAHSGEFAANVVSLAFSSDGDSLFATLQNGDCTQILSTRTVPRIGALVEAPITRVVVHDQYIAGIHRNSGEVVIMCRNTNGSTPSRHCFRRLLIEQSRSPASCLAWFPPGRLVGGFTNGDIHIWTVTDE